MFYYKFHGFVCPFPNVFEEKKESYHFLQMSLKPLFTQISLKERQKKNWYKLELIGPPMFYVQYTFHGSLLFKFTMH